MSSPPPVALGRHGPDRVQGTRRIVEVMGTVVTLDLRDVDPTAPAVDRAVAWLHWVDQTFSTYRPHSQVSRLAAGTLRPEDCAPQVRQVLDLCDRAAALSGGYFTDHPGGRFDPSGMVKGWSVKLASDLLCRAGVAHHCLTAGGDVQCSGVPAEGEGWGIGVVDPFDPRRLVAVVAAWSPGAALAVATSGTTERGLHVVDPLAGVAAADLASVTVVGADLTHVDWVATAAFAMGHDSRPWLQGLEGVEAYAVTADGSHWATDGFGDQARVLARGGGPRRSGERQVVRPTVAACSPP